MKKAAKRLAIAVETLRPLQHGDLGRLHGGSINTIGTGTTVIIDTNDTSIIRPGTTVISSGTSVISAGPSFHSR